MNKVRLILTIIVVFLVANFGVILFTRSGLLKTTNLWSRPDTTALLSGEDVFYCARISELCDWLRAYLCQRCRKQTVVGPGCALWLVDVSGTHHTSFFIAYAVQPVPAVLMSKQVLAELGHKIILGIVTAFVYGKGRLGNSPSALSV